MQCGGDILSSPSSLAPCHSSPCLPLPVSPTAIRYRLRLNYVPDVHRGQARGPRRHCLRVDVKAEFSLRHPRSAPPSGLPVPRPSFFASSTDSPFLALRERVGHRELPPSLWLHQKGRPCLGRSGPGTLAQSQSPSHLLAPRVPALLSLARLCCSSPEPSLPPSSPPFLVRAQKCLVVCGTLHSLFGGHLPTSTVVMTVSR